MIVDGRGYLRVPREVVRNALGWTVTFSEFMTTDYDLAEAVRKQLDLVDPVKGPQCLHTGDQISIRKLSDPHERLLCQNCGLVREVVE